MEFVFVCPDLRDDSFFGIDLVIRPRSPKRTDSICFCKVLLEAVKKGSARIVVENGNLIVACRKKVVLFRLKKRQEKLLQSIGKGGYKWIFSFGFSSPEFNLGDGVRVFRLRFIKQKRTVQKELSHYYSVEKELSIIEKMEGLPPFLSLFIGQPFYFSPILFLTASICLSAIALAFAAPSVSIFSTRSGLFFSSALFSLIGVSFSTSRSARDFLKSP